ncbi:MAG: DUF1080 domain-containing protein [Chitinophagaceae bacterium]
MKKLLLLIGITTISCFFYTSLQARSIEPADPSPEGRWDITVYDNGREFPSWLEIYHSGHKRLVGQYVGIVGSARPVSIINYKEAVISFTLPPQWEGEDNDLRFEARFQGDSLAGTMVAANGKTYNWTGHRAPLLKPKAAPVWGKAIKLFNGKDLDGWKALGKTNQWVVENGVLKSPKSGANLITTTEFTDFKLHIEFRCPSGSNSGVYLRGRYEVQIEDSYGKEPQKDYMGAVYGFIKPSEMAAKPAGEWQSYDITLTGRMITVVANGKTIICNQEIPGITGGAINSREGEPGPLLIQGDHGPIEYRNIVITPTK